MDKLIAVIKREYLERVRTRAFVIATLIVPLFISAVMLVPAYLASRAAASASLTDITILDATGAGLGDRVATLLLADSARTPGQKSPVVRKLDAAGIPAAENQALRAVMSNATTGYLVLTDSTLAGRSARYDGRNASSIADMDKLQTTVRQAVTMARLQQEGVQPARIEALSHLAVRLTTERVDDKGKGGGEGRTAVLVGFGIAFLLYFSIILHGQAVLRGVLEEKTSRVAEVVLSSVKPDTLLAGKVLGLGAVGLTQQILWLGISAYILQNVAPLIMRSGGRAGAAAAQGGATAIIGSGVLTPGLFAAVLAFFLVGFVFYATLFAAAGAMVNSEQEAQQAAQPVMILLVATIVLIQVVMLNPVGPLAQTLSWLPFSSPIVMPMRMTMMAIPWWQVVGSIVVGLVGCAGTIWLAARIYRVGMLMYGKKPSFAELARWIRYAR